MTNYRVCPDTAHPVLFRWLRKAGRNGRDVVVAKGRTAYRFVLALGIYYVTAGVCGMQVQAAVLKNDSSLAEQWALYNDGSFSMENEKNRYPVYNDPFGAPVAPGAWKENPGAGASDSGTGKGKPSDELTALSGIDINVTEAWGKYGGGTRDVIVAMIDTGIDYSHEDLTGAVWINEDEIPGNGIDDDGNGYIDDVYGWNFYKGNNQVYQGLEDSHGTHGAGTIAAVSDNGQGIAGIVPGGRVRIMTVKTLGGADGGGSTSALIRAIRYAEDNGAMICNLGLISTADDRILYEAIADSNMLFIVAAGNGDAETGIGVNIDETPCYPAAYDLDNIISVANIRCDGSLDISSNYGARSVDLAAPGSYILSTTPNNSYSYMSGTSMAAPMVTGAAAMVYSYFDGIDASDVKEILLSTTSPLESLRGRTLTGGMLNAGAALSFDCAALSKTGFRNAGRRPENGREPFIEAKLSESLGETFLLVRVVDIDGDLEEVLYAEGEWTKEQFPEEPVSKPFKLNDKDTGIFKLTRSGTYSFYARDRRGNTHVRTIRILEKEDGPGMFE